MRSGWTCPVCQRVHAPHIDECGPCNVGKMSPPCIPAQPYWPPPTIYPTTPLLPGPCDPPYIVTCGGTAARAN